MRIAAFLTMLFCVIGASNEAPASSERADAVATTNADSLFEYDALAPLDIEVTGKEEVRRYGAVIHHVTFPSPVAGRVTASIVMPLEADRQAAGPARRRYAGIVFLHWGQGNRTEFLSEALRYAKAGAVSITIDAPWARPEPWRQASEGHIDRPDTLRRMYAQTVIDIRRSADVLLARGDVDPARIAYVGHSFGATWGGVLAGVDHRFRTHVLMGGLPTLADFEPTGLPAIDSYIEAVRAALTPEQLERYVSVLAPMSGERFVGRAAPASVFMQFALFDSWISKRAATAYFDAASEPKRIAWYPTSHEFNDAQSAFDRARWLEREIGLSRVETCRGSTGPGLREVARSEERWTGVAVSRGGRIFVNLPRWSGSETVSVAELGAEGSRRAFPDETWNAWTSGSDPASRFVCVQSVYVDDRDDLWILDAGNPLLCGVVPGGAKLVRVDLGTNRVARVYPFDSTIAPRGSYLNDVRVDTRRGFAYVSESGEGAIVVVDLRSGLARRVLSNHASTKAQDTTFVVEGVPVAAAIHCDGIALDPKGEYLYYRPLSGRVLYRIRAARLRDASLSDKDLAASVDSVAETGIADGMEFDRGGNLYLTSLEDNALLRYSRQGVLETLTEDPRLKWPDSFSVAADGSVYVTTSQIHLGAKPAEPFRLFVLEAY